MGSRATQPEPGRHPRVRAAGVSAEPLDPTAVAAAVTSVAHGATVVFTGQVRDHDDGHPVTALAYEAHPSAEAVLAEVAAEVADAHPTAVVGAVHRVGELTLGDLAVVVAAAAPHRDEAFVAARTLIDELKARVPIWKHQRFADGSTTWVGSP